MANLTETATYDDGVYQIETTDPVLGGPTGVTNTPLKNLANRTAYLKAHVDTLETNMGNYAPIASPTFTGNPAAPTAAQFDNDTSVATTAFVQRALGSMRAATGFSANTTLTADHVGQLVQCATAGPYTITMPLVASIPDGAVISIISSATGTVTISRQGSDVIYPNMSTGITSITLATGDNAYFVKITGGWALIGGSASLRYTNDFGKNLITSGYQRLPSGLIMQWGTSVVNSASALAVTFPVAFPAAVLSICATPWLNTGTTGVGTNTQTVSGFNLYNGGGAQLTIYWIAYGY